VWDLQNEGAEERALGSHRARTQERQKPYRGSPGLRRDQKVQDRAKDSSAAQGKGHESLLRKPSCITTQGSPPVLLLPCVSQGSLLQTSCIPSSLSATALWSPELTTHIYFCLSRTVWLLPRSSNIAVPRTPGTTDFQAPRTPTDRVETHSPDHLCSQPLLSCGPLPTQPSVTCSEFPTQTGEQAEGFQCPRLSGQASKGRHMGAEEGALWGWGLSSCRDLDSVLESYRLDPQVLIQGCLSCKTARAARSHCGCELLWLHV
jgi:hypothetical protein